MDTASPHARVAPWIFTVCIGGVFLGVFLALLSMRLPTNRIVVFHQPYGTYVRIASVRITKPGFLVLYIDKGSGISMETPYYLEAGYYRNLTLPIDTEDIMKRAPSELPFIARLYLDDGDHIFNETFDTPGNDVMGRLINKRFWMKYARPPQQLVLDVVAESWRYIVDVLFP